MRKYWDSLNVFQGNKIDNRFEFKRRLVLKSFTVTRLKVIWLLFDTLNADLQKEKRVPLNILKKLWIMFRSCHDQRLQFGEQLCVCLTNKVQKMSSYWKYKIVYRTLLSYCWMQMTSALFHKSSKIQYF